MLSAIQYISYIYTLLSGQWALYTDGTRTVPIKPSIKTIHLSWVNTLKSVSIENLSINTTPKVGNANIYYKGLDSFSTPQISENNIIDTNLNFEVSSEDTIDYSKPILYNNCANPITISYVNSNLIDNYTINTENQIAYDGSLLKDCNIVLNDLKCSLSFYIVIENNLGYKYRCPVYIDIPLSNENTSIYDGTYIYTYNPNYEFYLYTNSSELVS